MFQRIKSRISKKAKGKKITFQDCEEDSSVPLAKSKSCVSLHSQASSTRGKRSSQNLLKDDVPTPDAKRCKPDVPCAGNALPSAPGCSHWSPSRSYGGASNASTVSPLSGRLTSSVTRVMELWEYTDDKLESVIAYATSGNVECEMDIHYSHSTGFSSAEMIEEMDRRHEERRLEWEDAELAAILDEPFEESTKRAKKNKKELTAR